VLKRLRGGVLRLGYGCMRGGREVWVSCPGAADTHASLPFFVVLDSLGSGLPAVTLLFFYRLHPSFEAG